MAAARTSAYVERVKLEVLLLGATEAEPSFRAWRVALEREGVPYRAITLERSEPARGAGDPARAAGNRPARGGFIDGLRQALFQAVILATGELLDAALSDSERSALEQFERELGIRRLTAYVYPQAAYGLSTPVWAGPLDGFRANLTPTGARVFPYLRGPVPIDTGSWGYLAEPLSADRFETLLAGPSGSALVGIHRDRDGREHMVQTFAANAGQTQSQLLRHGQLAWVTRGRYLGYERNYMPLHIDDVLLPNHSWNVTRHATDRHTGALIRMTAGDAAHAADFARSRGLRLDLACNGSGSERYTREAGVDRDPLLAALLDQREVFGWIDHTFGHVNLDDAPRATIESEIARNRSWAHHVGIALEPGALITGEHTGLANLATMPPRGENSQLAPALASQGIRFIACDASRPYPAVAQRPEGPRWPPGTPFAVGPALAVPRHPTALPYDAATREQVLDRRSTDGSGRTPLSWRQILADEVRRIFTALMSNDPRPHYFHQSNLVVKGTDGGPRGGAGGIFYTLIDAVLERYRTLLSPEAPIVQPAFGEIGELLSRWSAWRSALADGTICAYADSSRVTIVNRAGQALDVPLTGTTLGTDYGGTRSGWVQAPPGETIVLDAG